MCAGITYTITMKDYKLEHLHTAQYSALATVTVVHIAKGGCGGSLPLVQFYQLSHT